MAKAKEKPSKSSIMREILHENPAYRRKGGNAKVLERYSEITGKPTTNSDRQTLANVKSLMKRKKRRRKADADSEGEATPKPRKISGSALESLEIHIDDCLVEARAVGDDQLKKVIDYLRGARNHVVLMQG